MPNIRKYYEEKIGWFSPVFDAVDWDIFSPVYRKRAKKNLTWINKYCMQTLPTDQRMKQTGSNEVEHCCTCRANIEDDDHLFQCEKRPQFLKQLQKELKKYANKLDPKLLKLILEGISNYVKNEVDPILKTCQLIEHTGARMGQEVNPYAATYERVFAGYDMMLTEQASIGWDNLLCGKFSKQW